MSLYKEHVADALHYLSFIGQPGRTLEWDYHVLQMAEEALSRSIGTLLDIMQETD